jgi:putative ABC transport system permease protein
MKIPTPTGFVDVKVAGIWQTSNNNGYTAYVSPERFEQMFGDEPAESYDVIPDPGTAPEALVSRIDAADLDPDLYARTPDQAAAQLADEVGDQVTPFWTLQRLLLFVALVAALSTLLLMGVQRRRELGVLGATGFSPSALARMTISRSCPSARSRRSRSTRGPRRRRPFWC